MTDELTPEQQQVMAMVAAKVNLKAKAAETSEVPAMPEALPEESSFGDEALRKAAIFARSASPNLALGMAGGAIGGPPGAIAGGFMLPAADLMTSGYNKMVEGEGGFEPFDQMPSEIVKNLMSFNGPKPETTTERAISAAGDATGTGGPQLSALLRLAKTAKTEGGKQIAKQLSTAPGTQMAVSGPSAAASSAVTEMTDSPVLGILAGTGVAIAGGGFRPKKLETLAETRQYYKDQSSIAYKRSDAMGAGYNAAATDDLAQNIDGVLISLGYNKRITPAIQGLIEELAAYKGKPMSLKQMEQLRIIARNAERSDPKNAAQAGIGGGIVDTIDDFMESTVQTQLTSGNPAAMEVLKQARGLWRTNKKLELLEDIWFRVENKAANYTQAGKETALRQEFRTVANNKKIFKSFTKEEQENILKIVRGDIPQNFLRFMGKFAIKGPVSGVGTLGPSVMVTDALGPGAGAATAAGIQGTAFTADAIATQMGMNNVQKFQNTLANQLRKPTTDPMRAVANRGVVSALQGQQ
tara:strand:+ start:326 stop:1900 length:1575 start_codon:yes stop_codon:yes gene_type:complete